MKKESNSDEKNILKSETNEDMIDWWVGTVILTFFPILTSIIINICRNGYADFNRMVGDGELILSAFLVITPSVMNYFKADFNKKDQVHKKIFYLLLFVAFFELTTYTTIKTNPDNIVWVVYIASIICTVSSIIISWQSELFLKERNEYEDCRIFIEQFATYFLCCVMFNCGIEVD